MYLTIIMDLIVRSLKLILVASGRERGVGLRSLIEGLQSEVERHEAILTVVSPWVRGMRSMYPDSPQTDQPIVNIIGEKVALGPLRRDLMPLNVKWFNDFEIAALNGLPLRPTSAEAQDVWYEQLSKDGTVVVFTIYERTTLRPIGGTSLIHLDPANRTAEFTILIGEKDCWGQGYGTEATRLVLDYGFTALSLHNIYLRVFSYNVRAIRAYTRAGFKLIGRQREAKRVGDRAFDVIYMDCLATEFRSPLLYRLLPNEASASGQVAAG
jgi:diamine N-acetyltransferase